MEFSGILKKYNVESPGVDWKKVESPGLIKKKSYWISIENYIEKCLFLALEFLTGVTKFMEFAKVKLCFIQNFQV